MSEESMRWHFEPAKNDYNFAGDIKLGPYYVAEIFKTAGLAVNEYDLKQNTYGTKELAEKLVAVLNRELPGGKLRVRRKGAK